MNQDSDKANSLEGKEEIDVCQALTEMIEDGREEGREEGRVKTIIMQVIKKIRKNKTEEQIVDELEIEMDELEPIISCIYELSTDVTEEDVFEIYRERYMEE